MFKLLTALALAGCATAPQAHDIRTTFLISTPFDATWSALVDLSSEHAWPIAIIDKGSGLMTTNWILAPDRYADCGTAPMATNKGTRIKLSVRVRPHDERSELAINVTLERLWEFAGEQRLTACTSTGTAEAEVQASIVARAR